jgi:hypothetical protein
MQRLPWINGVHSVANEAGIDSGGLFYTETPVFATAELYIREVRRTAPDTARIY